MRIALDTNRYTDLCRGDTALAQLLEAADAVLVPFVVLAELRAGFAVGTHGRANERVLGAFLTKPGVDVVFASEEFVGETGKLLAAAADAGARSAETG